MKHVYFTSLAIGLTGLGVAAYEARNTTPYLETLAQWQREAMDPQVARREALVADFVADNKKFLYTAENFKTDADKISLARCVDKNLPKPANRSEAKIVNRDAVSDCYWNKSYSRFGSNMNAGLGLGIVFMAAGTALLGWFAGSQPNLPTQPPRPPRGRPQLRIVE
jgi:hypothetical protein